MFFGLTIEKLLVIGVIAAFILGPERLPRYAAWLARFTVQARDYLQGAKQRVKEEMGDDLGDVDWRKLDPRQYDPRRIIREALLEDAPSSTVRAVAETAAVKPVTASVASASGAVPFDSEAT